MPDFHLTFLGTGTSHGIPVIGCGCRVCRSDDPRDQRTRSAARLDTGSGVLQIDTPPDFRVQCLRGGYFHADAVLYTHSHMDHMIGFDDLRRFCELADREMPVHGSPQTLADLRRIFPYAFDGERRFRTYVRPRPVEITGPFEVCGAEVIPTPLPHGRITTTGLVFRAGGRTKLAYFTDCQEVPEAAVEAARDCDVLVIDALRHTPHPTHMTVEQAIEAARKIGARQTYLTHICHDLPHRQTEEALPAGIRLAYDGLTVAI